MIVCADDIGLTEDISQAALELVAMGRLSAVSCMVVGDRPPFADLRAHEARLDLGLHVTLTDAQPVAAGRDVPSLVGPDGRLPSFRTQLCRSFAGRIRGADVTRELSAQYARFLDWAGRLRIPAKSTTDSGINRPRIGA
jgi:chitin disaccharide deacetylase